MKAVIINLLKNKAFITIHIVITCLSSSYLCGQQNKALLYITKGEVQYKINGKWITARNGINLDDTIWTKMSSSSGEYIFNKKDICARITDPGLQQVRAQSYSVCENKSLLDQLKKIDPSKPIIPAGFRNAYTQKSVLLFPANGENLDVKSNVVFVWKNSTDRDFYTLRTFSEPVYKKKEQMSGNKSGQINNKYYGREGTLFIPIKSINKVNDTIVSYRNSLQIFSSSKYEKPQSPTAVERAYGWTIEGLNKQETPVEFRIAKTDELSSVQMDLKELDALKDNFDYKNYLLVKARIYTNYKMYSQAFKIYSELRNRYTESASVIDAYNELLDAVIILNYNYKKE